MNSDWFSYNAVENLAFKKESFINSRRTQYKRHIQNQWIHGHAGRAVDGESDHTTHSCTILDNFYVEKPVWMVDLGRKVDISGVVILTWMAKQKGQCRAIVGAIAFNITNRLYM